MSDFFGIALLILGTSLVVCLAVFVHSQVDYNSKKNKIEIEMMQLELDGKRKIMMEGCICGD